jgi:hypothetical protein
MNSPARTLLAAGAVLALSGFSLFSRNPVTYTTGWWPYQAGTEIKSLAVEVTESGFNLFKREGRVRVHLSGTVAYARGGWRPYVEKVHANERFVPSSDAENRFAAVEFTPIVDVKEDSSYKGSSVPFELSFEYPLHTFQWGPNVVLYRAGNLEQKVDVQQWK